MTFGLIILFMIVSVVGIIFGVVKRNNKIIIISLVGLVGFLMLGIAVFMALGGM